MRRTTLFRGGIVRPFADERIADWVLMDGESFVGAGSNDDVPLAERVVDLQGATLVPAFCDAHAHLPATGLYESGLDLRGMRSADQILHAFGERAGRGSDLLFAGNFEDPPDRNLTRADLDRVVGDRPAMLVRADMHSSIVSTALLDHLDLGALEGVDLDRDGRPTGYLREQAAAQAWRWFDSNLPPQQAKDAVRAAVRRAYSKGVARVHEMFVVEWRGWAALEVLFDAISDVTLDVSPYIATTEVAKVVEIGLPRIGGDFFLDGSFGSHTAWMKEPYAAAPPGGSSRTGIRYRTDEELVSFFTAAQEAGLQTGVHAIGDAAIEQALSAWETVADAVGIDEVRRLGHRIEHFECASNDSIARAAHLELRASVQPAFDRYWGGEEGMYADRIGWTRASEMNRFKSMVDAGLIVGAGSDSTVTPLDPFLQMAALRDHHLSSESVSAAKALYLHTIGGHALAGSTDVKGAMEAGKHADLALLDRDPLKVSTDEMLATEVLGTWARGVCVWPPDEAEAA